MAAVKAKNTGPELRVRRIVRRIGFRFRLHPKTLPGRPDIVFPKLRVALFVHGCFWHRHKSCGRFRMPRASRAYWAAKFARNVRRDRAAVRALNRAGWRVLVVWECTLKNEAALAQRLARRLNHAAAKARRRAS